MNMETKYTIAWYRPGVKPEIGPITEYETVESSSKTRAVEWGRNIAQERGWRYIAISDNGFSEPE